MMAGSEPVPVEEVPGLTSVDMAAFLVGVLHYCVCTVDNKDGKDTIDVLCPENSGNREIMLEIWEVTSLPISALLS